LAKEIYWLADNRSMNQPDKKHCGDTVRILRPPPKVYTTELGHNVWMSGVEPLELNIAAETTGSTDPYNCAADSGQYAN
jgi:hypothetical protein